MAIVTINLILSMLLITDCHAVYRVMSEIFTSPSYNEIFVVPHNFALLTLEAGFSN